jgi:hypothetical protein
MMSPPKVALIPSVECFTVAGRSNLRLSVPAGLRR